MPSLSRENQIALLLSSLSTQATDEVLARLAPHRAGRLRQIMNQQAKSPPAPELLEEVLRDLGEALLRRGNSTNPETIRIATDTLPHSDIVQTDSSTGSAPGVSRPRRVATTQPTGPEQDPTPPASSGDPIAELQAMECDHLAAALDGEHSGTVATVLDCLEAKRAGETLKRLAPDTRRDAFLRIGQPVSGDLDLVRRIVRAIVAKGKAAADSPADTSGDSKVKKMADMLKSMERTDRMDLLTALEERDGELAAKVRGKLYLFEDLLVIEGRSMQKLLAEIDSKTLALSLKDAAQEIHDKVTGNLSKRARETVAEEISFLGAIPAAQVQQARKAIVEVIQRLDQSGELVMTR